MGEIDCHSGVYLQWYCKAPPVTVSAWNGKGTFVTRTAQAGLLQQFLETLRHMINNQTSQSQGRIELYEQPQASAGMRCLVDSVARGLQVHHQPELIEEGLGGTYVLRNQHGHKAAILKPCDEEPLAPNNPKGYVGRCLGDPGWKPSVRVGEAAIREVAAYLLDREGFAKVPTSVLVRARHTIFCYNSAVSSAVCSGAWPSTQDPAAAAAAPPASPQPAVPLPMKLGSLQEFVPHECDTTEMGPSRFSVSDVHRIGILDIRLFNTDRHAGNMLVRAAKAESSGHLAARMVDSQFELIPIDHGFCLPETLDAPYFEWLHWPQAMLPFSEDELQYIRDLDCEADKELLRKELPVLRPECIRVLELTTALLKRCAEAGMTLFEIGSILSRPFVGGDEDPSELEKMCEQAKRAVEAAEEAAEAKAKLTRKLLLAEGCKLLRFADGGCELGKALKCELEHFVAGLWLLDLEARQNASYKRPKHAPTASNGSQPCSGCDLARQCNLETTASSSIDFGAFSDASWAMFMREVLQLLENKIVAMARAGGQPCCGRAFAKQA